MDLNRALAGKLHSWSSPKTIYFQPKLLNINMLQRVEMLVLHLNWLMP